MKKQKLLVVAGAGASKEFDVPMVDEVDDSLEKYTKKFLRLEKGPCDNLYGAIRSTLDEYFRSNFPSGNYRKANFEDILYAARFLDSIQYDVPGRSLHCAIAMPKYDWMLAEGPSPMQNYLFASALASRACDYLHHIFRVASIEAKTKKKSEIQKAKIFFNALSSKFDIGVITLNYDDILHQILPDLETGFDRETKKFDPRLIYGRNSWNFIYHLHGSVHFDYAPLGRREMIWNETLEHTSYVLGTPKVSRRNTESMPVEETPLIAGYGKLDQLQRDPYQTYLQELNRLIYECDSLLIIGYGFGDDHVNQCLKLYSNSARIRPVVVVTYEPDGVYSLRSRNDEWSSRLSSVFRFNKENMTKGFPTNRITKVDKIKESNRYDESDDLEISLKVWYNGFLKACENPELFMGALS